jgi:alginate O-acetyltransferase complex protein AlgI
MLFNSLQFLVFFIIVTCAYFLTAHKRRWLLLLLASCYFYMAFVPAYILILIFTIGVDYIAGLSIEKAAGVKRKWFLIASIIANIGVLAVFKYYNFFVENINALLPAGTASKGLPYLNILLPIGLTFHTFQAMSYTIEVYRGKQQAEKHFGIYALYVMFYPQLVAGPIERPQNLLPQFHTKHEFNREDFRSGLMQMMFGFFKKLVIADRLAMVVDNAYAHVDTQSGTGILVAVLFYAFQIYCDFSGYSDIAIGAARIMGFKLMENFHAPYFSKTIAEFWRRWHISLSSWFRDYLYIPMGGNKRGESRWVFNICIVFLASGLWHGANFTYLAWGGLNGLYIMAGYFISKWIPVPAKLKNTKWYAVLRVIITFWLVAFAFIIFRSASLSQAVHIMARLFSISVSDRPHFALNSNEMVFSFALIALVLIKDKFFFVLPVKNSFFFWTTIILLLLCCYFLGVFGENQFIYFQF